MRTRHALIPILLLFVAIFSRPALAAPNYDRRADVPRSPAGEAAVRARAALPALRAIAQVSEVDETFGQPTFLWANRLAPPAKQTPGRFTNRQAAGNQLARLAPFYGLDRADLSSVTLSRLHDTGRGGIIATYVQSIDGVPVYGERVNVLLDRAGDMVAASGFVTSRNAAPVGVARLDAAEAARRGLVDFAGSGAAAVRAAGTGDGGYQKFEATAGADVSEPIRVKRVLFHLPDRFEPAYTVELMSANAATGYVISAVDGSVLVRTNEMADANFTYRTWADPSAPNMPVDGPQGSGPTPHPTGTPSFYNPSLTTPILVSLQNGPIPTNDPWLAPSATQTLGNNVDAYADITSPDGFSVGDLRATTTGPNTFDRVYDTLQNPGSSTNQRMASITQLFYTTNFLHDWYYAAGFDEASGNAQADNYGRGGVAGDVLHAEAQDFGGTNNANMSTPSDGGSPRMQMYLFTPTLLRDGSIDNQVVAHEYGHYVSNRLIGDGTGLGNQQSGGMGEGWGDFQAMLLTVRPEDALASPFDFSGTFALGGYALTRPAAPGNGYYFGFRRYPYSTDMTKNPLTFKHVQEGTPLPVGPPVNANAGSNAEVHNTGEVWCTMLWECYAALLRDTGRLTFAQAQQRMRDELVAAYKLTPVNPTITEARDAVLAAAYATDPADHALFCAAFAKRGCGTGAISPPRFSTDNVGVTESYACGGAIAFVSATITDDVASCDNDGILDNGERGNLQITLRNVGATPLSATTVTVTSSNPSVQFPFGNVVNMPATVPFGFSTAPLTIAVSGAAGIETLDFSCAIADPGLLVAASPGAAFAPGNADLIASTSDDFQYANPAWTFAGAPLIPGSAWSRTPIGTNFGLFAPDNSGVSDQFAITPPLQVAGAGNFSFTFKERHSFETSDAFYDGGVIEITTNGGGTWTDIGASATPGYAGVIFTGADNPLSGRSAYVSTNAAYPGDNTVTVNLGTAYAGQTVQVRFRLGTDQAAADFGWRIDDLAFTNLVNQPFFQAIPEPDACTPVAVGDALPTEFAFALAGANPGHGIGALRFALPVPSHVTIGLYDVAGRRVAVLANGDFPAGLHSTSAQSMKVPGGVYFARMEAGARALVQRLVILQ